VGRFGRAAGYDPYGLLGGAGEGADPDDGGYEAGYAAGYAAAMAEVEAAVASAESAAGETAGGETPNVAAGPGDVLQPRPFPRSLIVWCPPRTLTPPWCPPRTVGTPFCPIPTPTFTRTITTTPQWQQPGVGGFGYGEDWGYDPYGQSPFQG
jgi:hypothetical protein